MGENGILGQPLSRLKGGPYSFLLGLAKGVGGLIVIPAQAAIPACSRASGNSGSFLLRRGPRHYGVPIFWIPACEGRTLDAGSGKHCSGFVWLNRYPACSLSDSGSHGDAAYLFQRSDLFPRGDCPGASPRNRAKRGRSRVGSGTSLEFGVAGQSTQGLPP